MLLGIENGSSAVNHMRGEGTMYAWQETGARIGKNDIEEERIVIN